jgi:hypothetical protein
MKVLPATEAIKITTMAGCAAVKNNIRFIFNKSVETKEMTTEELTIEVEKSIEEIRPS